MKHLMTHRPALAGILFMLLGMFMFSANDVVGKWLVSTYTVGQVLLVRSIGALVVLAFFLNGPLARDLFRPPQPGLQFIRVTLSTVEVALFYWAVSYLTLAETVTFYLAGPIYVALLARSFLGEVIPWPRWVVIGIGFVGVVIALNPGSGVFGWPALIAIAGSLAFSVMMIVTRQLKGTPDVTLVFWQMVSALVFGAVMAPVNWIPPTVFDYLLLLGLGIVALFAHLATNKALKLAPASTVAPYQFTLIVWAMVLGYLVFGDVPQVSTLIGGAIIVGAGGFIFWDEQRRKAG